MGPTFEDVANFQKRVGELLRAAQGLGLQICGEGIGPKFVDTRHAALMAFLQDEIRMGNAYCVPVDPAQVVSSLDEIVGNDRGNGACGNQPYKATGRCIYPAGHRSPCAFEGVNE